MIKLNSEQEQTLSELEKGWTHEQSKLSQAYKSSNLNAYRVSLIDPSSGADIVFAHTAKEAKTFAWNSNEALLYADHDSYIDIRIRRIRTADIALAADIGSLRSNTPHVGDTTPFFCNSCELWGYHYVQDMCEGCKGLQECLDQ